MMRQIPLPHPPLYPKAPRARTSGLSAHIHMLPHLSSEILIWMANSPTFVRGALSPLAGVQSCNEQQLARRPVLRSCIPHPDECVICCLFRTRFCSDSNRPRTHTRPVCVTHLAMAHSSCLQDKKGLKLTSCYHHNSCLWSRCDSFKTGAHSAILRSSNCRFLFWCNFLQSDFSLLCRSQSPYLHNLCREPWNVEKSFFSFFPPERILMIHQHLHRALLYT